MQNAINAISERAKQMIICLKNLATGFGESSYYYAVNLQEEERRGIFVDLDALAKELNNIGYGEISRVYSTKSGPHIRICDPVCFELELSGYLDKIEGGKER